MATKLINSGSGKIKDDSIIAFSYSEDATPLEPTSSNGGTSQVSVSAVEETTDAALANTKLMINNSATIEDSEFGSVQFNVKKVSTNAAGIATIIGDSVQSKLNVIKTAAPFSGTLSGAITYYCGLCGVTPVIDSALNSKQVAFIGWSGNVWEHLKDLCSVISYSNSERSPVEIYFTGTAVGFRPALVSTIAIEDYVSDINQSIEIFDAAQSLDVYCYNTELKTNAIVYDISYYDPNSTNYAKRFLSSFSDSLQVGAGETKKVVFKINASLSTVKQPECVSTILPFPYDPSTSGNGQYVVVGTDNLPIQPSQWVDQGGSLTVAITENPNEIELTIVAPPETALLKSDGSGLGYAPYRIAKETSGSGFDYPAIYIVGSGIFYEKTVTTFQTAAEPSVTSKDEAFEVDNIFITDNFTLANAGLAAAQASCGPLVTLNGSSASGFAFGSSIGSSFSINSSRFRLESIGFSQSGITWNSHDCARFSDFNTANAGKTFGQFNTKMTSSASFTDFSVIPLTIGA
jgi:hypothetical protein